MTDPGYEHPLVEAERIRKERAAVEETAVEAMVELIVEYGHNAAELRMLYERALDQATRYQQSIGR